MVRTAALNNSSPRTSLESSKSFLKNGVGEAAVNFSQLLTRQAEVLGERHR